jgi:hypothetical protein
MGSRVWRFGVHEHCWKGLHLAEFRRCDQGTHRQTERYLLLSTATTNGVRTSQRIETSRNDAVFQSMAQTSTDHA